MKTIIFFAGLLLSTASFAQVSTIDIGQQKQIGEAYAGGKAFGVFVAKISYVVNSANDTTYLFTYRNGRYYHIEDIKTISFNSEGDSFNTFFNILMDAFNAPNDNNKAVKIGDEDLVIITKKEFGSKILYVSNVGNNALFSITKPQVKKIFGK